MAKGFMVKSGWGFRLSVVCAVNVAVLTGGYVAVCGVSAAGAPSLLAVASVALLASLTMAFMAHLTFVLT